MTFTHVHVVTCVHAALPFAADEREISRTFCRPTLTQPAEEDTMNALIPLNECSNIYSAILTRTKLFTRRRLCTLHTQYIYVELYMVMYTSCIRIAEICCNSRCILCALYTTRASPSSCQAGPKIIRKTQLSHAHACAICTYISSIIQWLT